MTQRMTSREIAEWYKGRISRETTRQLAEWLWGQCAPQSHTHTSDKETCPCKQCWMLRIQQRMVTAVNREKLLDAFCRHLAEQLAIDFAEQSSAPLMVP